MNPAVIQFSLSDAPVLEPAWRVFSAVCRLTREALPIADMSVLYEPDMHDEWEACHRTPDVGLLSEQERRLADVRTRVGALGVELEGEMPGLSTRRNLDPESPHLRQLNRQGQVVATQYRGMLDLRVDGPAARCVVHAWRDVLGRDMEEFRGWNFCPPQGFLPWHTNRTDRIGWRMYVVHCQENDRSAFHYWREGQEAVGRVPDHHGCVNLFKVHDVDLLWHAVVSRTFRFSCGMSLSDTAVLRLIEGLKGRFREYGTNGC